ncbi:MAG TPA: hypothetical protein VHA34_01765 [Actinomycetes bacterium]|nr:hypothetical protein [Actinomycetes bacterium]
MEITLVWEIKRQRHEPAGHALGLAVPGDLVTGILVFTGGPMIASLVLSFTEYDVISAPTFIGLDNYRQLTSTRRWQEQVQVGNRFVYYEGD